MATLNLPAWGYGLRYRYGLFKQQITKEGQAESAEDWLEVLSKPIICHETFSFTLERYYETSLRGPIIYILQKFSPWEIVRHDVVYPVRFFGHVQVNPDGS